MKPHTMAIPKDGERDNNVLMQIRAGQNIAFEAPNSEGTFGNNNTIYVRGGLAINADLKQSNGSQIDVLGGRLALNGATNGGFIGITSGMLEFTHGQSYMRQPGVGSFAAEEFHCGLAFNGFSATVRFDQTQHLSMEYRPVMNDILVTSPYVGQIADLHLIGGPNPYSASEFSIQDNGSGGSDLKFHFIRA